MTNLFGGMTAAALLGSSSTLDNSLLNYYNAKINSQLTTALSSALTSTSSTSSTPIDQVTVPPWDSSKDTLSDQAKLADALTDPTFITTTGSYFDNSSVPDDLKQLFTAYVALSKLNAIATSGAAEGTVSGALSGLDKTFQKGLSDLNKYLNGVSFEKLTLIEGQKLPTAKSTLAVPRNLEAKYVGATVVQGAYDDPVTLTGNQTFEASVKKGGSTVTVSIDLSQMTDPPTLDNIAAFINSKLAASNIVSRVARNKIADGQFGLVVKGVETETLTLSATAGTPALYIAGTSGLSGDVAGQLLRIDDNGTSASTAYARRISATGTTSSVTTTSASGTSTVSTDDDSTVVDTSSSAPTTAKNVALDAQGHVYVVGTAEGTLAGQEVQGAQDVYLTKYDSAGKVIWTQLLGATSNADGFAVATDSKGNVVIAGNVDAPLTQSAVGGGKDSFVTKFNSEGEEIFTRQVDPLAEDGATALAIGPDDSIYVGGYAKSAITSTSTYAGAGDATVTKLSATGTRLYAREFGTAGSDTTRAVAVASDGNLLVASVENDRAILRKFDSTDGAAAALWTVDLGALQGGTIGAITVDGGAIYVGGATSNAALNAGGSASIVNAASGGKDGFVARIDDNGTSADANFTTYIGSASSDAVHGITVANGTVYVTGDTQGALPGQTQVGAINGFVAKLDGAGAVAWTTQYGGRQGAASGAAIVADAKGKSVLDQLGLPKGSIDYTTSQLLTANSTLRAGDSFAISVNGGPARSIMIGKDDTIQSLKTKLNTILLQAGKSSSSYSSHGYQLSVTANPGTRIEFIAGKKGFDALAGLGIRAGVIVNESPVDRNADTPSKTIPPAELTPDNNFIALGMDAGISLASKDAASKAQTQIESAMRNIRLAYTALTEGKFVAGTGKYANSSNGGGAVPAYLQSQLANYQAGLQRLGISTTSSGSSGTSLLGIG